MQLKEISKIRKLEIYWSGSTQSSNIQRINDKTSLKILRKSKYEKSHFQLKRLRERVANKIENFYYDSKILIQFYKGKNRCSLKKPI